MGVDENSDVLPRLFLYGRGVGLVVVCLVGIVEEALIFCWLVMGTCGGVGGGGMGGQVEEPFVCIHGSGCISEFFYIVGGGRTE